MKLHAFVPTCQLTQLPCSLSTFRRNQLFEISGVRGEYPQFFLIEKSGETHYIGDWETVESINDTSGLPKAMVETDPGAVTWDRLLNAGVAT
jgi:hypothetical protein